MIKTRVWIIIISVFTVLCAVLSVIFMNLKSGGKTVEIVSDGVVIKRIDLSKVTEEYSFDVEYKDGKNTVTVQPGRICVSYADCPDKICVDYGWLSDQIEPVVCMPHRLIIRLVSSDIDAAAE